MNTLPVDDFEFMAAGFRREEQTLCTFYWRKPIGNGLEVALMNEEGDEPCEGSDLCVYVIFDSCGANQNVAQETMGFSNVHDVLEKWAQVPLVKDERWLEARRFAIRKI